MILILKNTVSLCVRRTPLGLRASATICFLKLRIKERTGMLFSCLVCMCLNISVGFFYCLENNYFVSFRLNAFHVQEENYTLRSNVSDPVFLLSPNIMPNSQRACCQIKLYWYLLEIWKTIMASLCMNIHIAQYCKDVSFPVGHTYGLKINVYFKCTLSLWWKHLLNRKM